jgi:uncharacterized membrane protein
MEIAQPASASPTIERTADGPRPTVEAPAAELERLRALERRVIAAVDSKRKGRDVNQLHEESQTFGQRLADDVARLVGSWRFIIVQSAMLAVWIVLNVTQAIWRPWDPYPFILLNLVLSFQAAYSSPIIMMSQNRQSAKDRLQAELDLRTDLKAEALIEDVHGRVEDLRLHRWKELLDMQQQQIGLLLTVVQRLEAQAAALEPAH